MFEEYLPAALYVMGPLLGIILGGLITYFTMHSIEQKRSKQERKEKLACIERNALTAALAWIDPMRNAEIRASSLLMSVIHGNTEVDRFLEEYPYLLGELVQKELPAKLRAILPNNVYQRGHQIIRELEDVRILGVKYGQEVRLRGKPLPGFKECSDKLDAINKKITELDADLQNAFRQTFK